jgi:membrane fusion protein, multidrug efflux system
MNQALDTLDTLPRKANAQAASQFERLALEPKIATPDTDFVRNGKAPATSAPKKNHRRNIIGAVVLVAAAVTIGVYYVKNVAPYETTDDAFIDAHVTAVAPQVAGRVVSLLAQDNQSVKKGAVLLEIDPRDFQVKVDQAIANLAAAKSRLAQANAQYAVDQAKTEQELANVTATEAEATRAEADYKRALKIGTSGVSQSEIDLALAAARSTAAQVLVAKNKALAAKAQEGLSAASIQTAQADVEQNEASLRQAELDLSYTHVTAPEDGYVTHRSVEPGAYVQTGQALLALVPREVWVVANFKETQLKNMQVGQTVEVKVDAYPHVTFKGHVDSIQAGTGARFSLLPPENASGNYVKVVQRVPVKIVLDNLDAEHLLGPGMSVEPEVRVN